MTLVLKPGYSFDSDASTYIDAVETADGQALETGVRVAINDFVLGCKQDEIWDAIKASCILAGARTLDGALVPLTGGAPTNFNFVSGDYDRETGLVGDGSTKYLDSNRNNNSDPQNSKHLSVYRTEPETRNTTRALIGLNSGSELLSIATTRFYRINGSQGAETDATAITGLVGGSRPTSSITQARYAGVTTDYAANSTSPISGNTFVFGRNLSDAVNSASDARISFYSIGESLDLALLDTRVSNLMTAIGAAIP